VDVRAAVKALPAGPGVYRFRDARRRVLYVGRAGQLRRRVGSYWSDLGDRPHLAAMVPRISLVEAVACESEHEAAWLERNLLERRLPPWNRTAGGQEVAVCIRVDASARSAGLAVLHVPVAGKVRDGVQFYGPYLGGARVRLAAAGLHRVLPLCYAAEAGSAVLRELASRRSIGPADRAALARALGEVLAREPGAVARMRAELALRRDGAAAAEAYELAGRIQAELAAVDWITSPQRVASLEQYDADVAGWADGVLVRFELRAGLLCGWRQLARTAAQAAPWLAATPPGWQDFAHRNAVLAVQLRTAG
jgi:excinuclease ABC subunit C